MSEEFWTLFLVDDMYLMCQCPIFVLRPFEVPEGELGFWDRTKVFVVDDNNFVDSGRRAVKRVRLLLEMPLVSLKDRFKVICYVVQEKKIINKKGLKIKVPKGGIHSSIRTILSFPKILSVNSSYFKRTIFLCLGVKILTSTEPFHCIKGSLDFLKCSSHYRKKLSI